MSKICHNSEILLMKNKHLTTGEIILSCAGHYNGKIIKTFAPSTFRQELRIFIFL